MEVAYAFGSHLAGRGIRVIYGGGDVGLMGAVAKGALESEGEVIGIIPQDLLDAEVGHEGLTQLHVVASMHERKTMMADLADGFVALPGGIGTLEELFEAFTWTQLSIHRKPCALLNVAGYYDRLLEFLEQIVETEFLKRESLQNLITGSDPQELLAAMEDWEHCEIPKWFGRS